MCQVLELPLPIAVPKSTAPPKVQTGPTCVFRHDFGKSLSQNGYVPLTPSICNFLPPSYNISGLATSTLFDIRLLFVPNAQIQLYNCITISNDMILELIG